MDSIETARQQVSDAIGLLAAMSPDEIGELVNLMGRVAQEIGGNLDLYQTQYVLPLHANSFDILADSISRFRRMGDRKRADAAVVWFHSHRCSFDAELFDLGSLLWSELERGFPHAEAEHRRRPAGTQATRRLHRFQRLLLPGGPIPQPQPPPQGTCHIMCLEGGELIDYYVPEVRAAIWRERGRIAGGAFFFVSLAATFAALVNGPQFDDSTAAWLDSLAPILGTGLSWLLGWLSIAWIPGVVSQASQHRDVAYFKRFREWPKS